MATIETYQARIDALKNSIETSKGVKALTIAREDGTACEIKYADALNLEWGAVIIDDEGSVYVRTAGSESEYWCATAFCQASGSYQTQFFSLQTFYTYLQMQANEGRSFRFIHQTGTR